MSRSSISQSVLVAGVLALLLCAGYFGAESIRRASLPLKKEAALSNRSLNAQPLVLPNTKIGKRNKPNTKNPFAIPNEHVLSFDSDEDLEELLKRLQGTGIDVIGRIDNLKSIRVRTSDVDWLRELADKARIAPNYAVFIPRPRSGSIQPGAVGFGTGFLEFLGIFGDHTDLGNGVKVAVIDSGVAEHPTFGSTIQEFNLTNSTSLETAGHGTAMASIIVGNDPQAPGIAPSADLISFRVFDDSGSSSTFLVADAITQAVDQGVNLINISLGTYGDSLLVREAIQYAENAGTLIIASAGNEELNALAFPAAYSGVVSVGAVEASGEHANFSNTSNDLDIAAPGYQIRSAYPDQRLIDISGTSPAASVVTGSVAAILSLNPDLSSREAYDLIVENTHEAGIEGTDAKYGNGTIHLGSFLRNPDVEYRDLALADIEIVSNEVHFVYQNQGNTTLPSGTTSLIEIDGNRQEIQIDALEPGETQSFVVNQTIPEGEQIRILGQVTLQQGFRDDNLNNNFREETLPILKEEE